MSKNIIDLKRVDTGKLNLNAEKFEHINRVCHWTRTSPFVFEDRKKIMKICNCAIDHLFPPNETQPSLQSKKKQ